MTASLPIDQLEVVAFIGDAVPANALRPLAPVFRRRDMPSQIVWPTRIELHQVFATEVGPGVLEAAVAAGAVTMIANPLPAHGSDWALTPTPEGGVRYVRGDEIWQRQFVHVRERLSAALEAWHLGDQDRSSDLFDEAYLSSRHGLVAAALRAGAAGRGDDPGWRTMCMEDLARTLEYQGASLSSCRANLLWGGLPHPALREEFLDQARRGYDQYCEPSNTAEAPVAPAVKQLAVAFALYRRLRPDVSARLATRDVVRAIAGHPDAIAAIAARLSDDPDWQRCVERSSSVGEVVPDVTEALARAQLEDFGRFARTLYTLEITAERRDRRASWTNFCSRTAGVDAVIDAVPWRAGERIADHTRQRLGLNGDRISGIRRFAEEQAGVFFGPMATFARHDCASSAPRNTPPCVFVSQPAHATADDALRRRFAIAHEMGHLLADRQAANAWICSTVSHDRSEPEKRANAFAAYFMAPRHEVRELVSILPEINSSSFVEAAARVREHFGLSAVAAGEHLLNCHREPFRERLPEEIRNKLSDQLGNRPIEFEDVANDAPALDATVNPLRQGHYRELVERLKLAGVFDDDTANKLLGQS